MWYRLMSGVRPRTDWTIEDALNSPGSTDPVQDLEKAVHYLQREIANRRLNAAAVPPPAVNQ